MKDLQQDIFNEVYNRAMEYCVAKYGREPVTICICWNGLLAAQYEEYMCGEWESWEEIINPSDLTQDLSTVYAERLKKEEEERWEKARKQQELNKQQEEYRKKERKQQYLKLKQEFEN